MVLQTISIGTHENVNYDIGNPKIGRAVIFKCTDCGLDVSEERILEKIECNEENLNIDPITLAWSSNDGREIEKQCVSCGTPFDDSIEASLLIADNETRHTWPIVQVYCSNCTHVHMKPTIQADENISRFIWFNGTTSTTNAEGECKILINKDSGWIVPYETIVRREKSDK